LGFSNDFPFFLDILALFLYFSGKKEVVNEAHLSTAQSEAEKNTRVQEEDVHPCRKKSLKKEETEG